MKRAQVTYEPVVETAEPQADVVILRRDEYEQLQATIQAVTDQYRYWLKRATDAESLLRVARRTLEAARNAELGILEDIEKLNSEE